MNQAIDPVQFTVPLSFEAHAIAQQGQTTATQKTYLKALAVYAVEFYLRCIGFTPDAQQSDWRDPWMAKFLDIADVSLPSQGKLECCWVRPEAQTLQISADAWTDRIAYLAVQISANLKSATLLGFTITPVAELPLSQLRSLAEFPAFLQQMQPSSQAATESATIRTSLEAGSAITMTNNQTDSESVNLPVNLRQWLEGTVSAGWQTLEAALGLDSMQRAFVRSGDRFEITVRQAKLIDVGMDLGEQSVLLSLAVTPNPDKSMNVLVQLYPVVGTSYLVPGLQLVMLAETGEVLQNICSREQDNYIQLKHFRGEAGDSFDIQVCRDTVCIRESFIL